MMHECTTWSRWETGPWHRTTSVETRVRTMADCVCGWSGPVKELVAGTVQRPGRPMCGSIVNVCARCAGETAAETWRAEMKRLVMVEIEVDDTNPQRCGAECAFGATCDTGDQVCVLHGYVLHDGIRCLECLEAETAANEAGGAK